MSLDPAKLNFVVWKGTTFKKRLTYYADEDATTPFDLTGYTATCPIRTLAGDPLVSLTTENNGIILGGASGTIDLVIPVTATAELPWSTALYTLKITSPGGDTDALLHGGFIAKTL